MPAKKQPDWKELRLGIAVVSAIALAGFVIVLIGAQRGPFLPDTYTLYLDLDDAAGIRAGSPVRVGGVDAGEVVNLEIVPPSTEVPPTFASDTLLPVTGEEPDLRDIRVELAVHERFRRVVTTSSRAELASIGMGGERYVKISVGDVREAPLEPGAEIPAVASVDWDIIVARLSRALSETREITALSSEIGAKVDTGAGTLGRLLTEDAELYPRITRLQAESAALLLLLDQGPGLIPHWRTDPTLAARIDSLAASAAAIEAALDSGPVASWTGREELDEALDDLRASLADLDARMGGGHGSLGRILHDEELFLQISVLQARLGELITAFKADPLGFVNIQIF